MNLNLLTSAKITISSCLVLLQLNAPLCAQNRQEVFVKNSSTHTIQDYIVEIPVEKLNLNLGEYTATNGSHYSPVEIVSDVRGNYFALFCIKEISANESSKYIINKGNSYAYPKRTYAELSHKIGGQFVGREYIGGDTWVKSNYLSLPGSFTDHSYYIKYEGPGWESDKTAYRFYLDNRNAIDAFGKTTSDLVLPAVGTCEFDAYHKLAVWGMDNLKVGKALGLGTIATWDGKKAVRVDKKDSTICLIAADGKLRSQVKTIYYGWKANDTKCNLTSLISIDAGSRASHMELLVDKPIDNIATGIIKDSSGKLIVSNDKNSEWTYIATFGKQSVNKDRQGLVVFARTKQVKQITEDELNHVLVLQPDKDGYVDYYFMMTWELEKEPIKSESEFMTCINEMLLKLNDNISVAYK